MMNRREFLGTAIAAASTVALQAQEAPPWGEPVIDIHHHTRRTPENDLEHLSAVGIPRANLLTGARAVDRAKALIQQHPKRFIHFVSADIAQPEGLDLLTKLVKDGAHGMGEIKLHLPLDGPEMRRLYATAAELNVPVLIHFQEVEHFAGEGNFAWGFPKLGGILKEFPKTTFIGHADNFWANISADVPGDAAYPQGRVKPGGLTDRWLGEYPNLYGDLAAGSGNNSLNRDLDFTAGFLDRHQDKLMFGSDCPCQDGQGKGQNATFYPARLIGKCLARDTLTTLKKIASPDVFRKITWQNAGKLLKFNA
jgi:predicted TIM-barrel fold metal-dependent hydrolase